MSPDPDVLVVTLWIITMVLGGVEMLSFYYRPTWLARVAFFKMNVGRDVHLNADLVLVNALCHRDYSRAGGAISVAVYDDRLEIWSDGNLPSGITIGDLKREHQSRPRNPLIADTFYRRGLVERWGRGTQKIVELCVKAGHPEPEFLEQAGAVGVRFLPSGYVAPHRVPHDLTERQRRILTILSGAPSPPFRDIRAKLENPPADRTLRDDLAHLKRLGLISSDGHGRSAVWKLEHTPAD